MKVQIGENVSNYATHHKPQKAHREAEVAVTEEANEEAGEDADALPDGRGLRHEQAECSIAVFIAHIAASAGKGSE